MSLSKKHYKKIAELISDNIVAPNKDSNVNYIAIGVIWKLAEFFKTENINFNTDIFFKKKHKKSPFVDLGFIGNPQNNLPLKLSFR